MADFTRLPREALSRYPAQLSGGQRQRLGIMRALMLDPAVILLDEPMGALDPLVRYDLQEDLRKIFQSLGKTVAMVTHDMGEAGFFGDRVILLGSGRIVQEGTLDDLLRARPTTLSNDSSTPSAARREQRRLRMRLISTAFFVLVCGLPGRTFCDEPQVRIGSKASIENIVLGELLTHLARDAGAKAEHRSALGGTQVAYRALLKGDIDRLSPNTPARSKAKSSKTTTSAPPSSSRGPGERGLAMSQSLGFNNPYAIGMTDKRAAELNIAKISDLARPAHANLRLAFSEEFVQRPDGWTGPQGGL